MIHEDKHMIHIDEIAKLSLDIANFIRDNNLDNNIIALLFALISISDSIIQSTGYTKDEVKIKLFECLRELRKIENET